MSRSIVSGFVFGLTVATIGFFADGASAAAVDLGSHSASEIQGACKKAGGKFWISPGGNDFGCEKKNCDGQGGSCTVLCTGGGNTCEGNTPARVAPPSGKGTLDRSPAVPLMSVRENVPFAVTPLMPVIRYAEPLSVDTPVRTVGELRSN